MKLVVYGLVPLNEDVDDDFFLVNETIANDVFRKYDHEVYRVNLCGRVYEDFFLEVRDTIPDFILVDLIAKVTHGGYYSVNGRMAVWRNY